MTTNNSKVLAWKAAVRFVLGKTREFWIYWLIAMGVALALFREQAVGKGQYLPGLCAISFATLLLVLTFRLRFFARPFRWVKAGLPVAMYPGDEVEKEALGSWARAELVFRGMACAKAWAEEAKASAERRRLSEVIRDHEVGWQISDLAGLERFRERRTELNEDIRTAREELIGRQRVALFEKKKFLRRWDAFRAFDMLPENFADATAFLNHCKNSLETAARQSDIPTT